VRNGRYSSYYMYLTSTGNGVYVAKSINDQDDWDLYQPPTAGLENRSLEFFLGSTKYNNWVVSSDYVCTDGGRRRKGGSSCKYQVEALPVQSLGANAVGNLAIRLYAPPGYYGEPNGTQSVMIESYQYPGHFFNVGAGSWSVSAYRNDPGAVATGLWSLRSRESNFSVTLALDAATIAVRMVLAHQLRVT